ALDVSASFAEGGALAVFVVNRSRTDAAQLNIRLADVKATEVTGVDILTGDDPKACNTWENPNVVAPKPGKARLSEDGGIELEIPAPVFAALRAATLPR